MTSNYLVFGAPCIGEEEIAEVVDSMRRGWIGTGPKVARFEEMIADYIGARHAVAVNSCTAALHLSLLASDIGPGAEVITTPLTFAATINAIIHAGATPVLVDCDLDTQLIHPDAIRCAITPRTRAILPVHMAGRICDMDAITAIADENGLLVVEDAAHALEGRWRGAKVGTMSSLTCFSFYATKNITTAEGGVVTTNDSELARRIKILALHGMSHDAWRRYSDAGYRHYDIVYPGFKYNMPDLNAAIGIHQLGRVNEWLRRREQIWDMYDAAFAHLPVALPAPAGKEMLHARHLYTTLIDADRAGISRDECIARLHSRGIGTGVHYRPVHVHPYYQERFGWKPEDFPNATLIGDRTLSLPLSPCLSDADVARVITAFREVFER